MVLPSTAQTDARFGHMGYCFEAYVNRTWAIVGILKFPFESNNNCPFYDFNKRAVNRP